MILLYSHSCVALIFFLKIFIYLFLAVLSLHCCKGYSLVVTSMACSLVAEHRFLMVVVSLVVQHSM